MQKFGHILWGYELFYPDDWVHKSIRDVQGFALNERALEPGFTGPGSGHLLVRADWNSTGQSLESIWNRHLGMTSGMIGAKKVGTAAWEMAGLQGFEAEIVLPKQEKNRLWTGILSRGFIILNLMVTHPKDERSAFEPPVTRIITSLRFPETMGEFPLSRRGIPLPPGYEEMDARQAVEDIDRPRPVAGLRGRKLDRRPAGLLPARAAGPGLDDRPVLAVPGAAFPGPNEPGICQVHLAKGGNPPDPGPAAQGREDGQRRQQRPDRGERSFSPGRLDGVALELAHIQVVVKTLPGEQLFMVAALDNLPLFDHQ